MTLITSMIFLLILTFVVMGASQTSIFDTYLARNNKAINIIYQETANNLTELATVENLYDPLMINGFDTSGSYSFTDTSDLTQTITDIGFEDDELYDCEGVSGRATSIGLSARKCNLFDFQVNKRQDSISGAQDRHHTGKGKEVPSESKYSNL